MKTQNIRHTIRLVEGGIEIETLKFETKLHKGMTPAQLKAKLKELMGWEPWDKYQHVIHQVLKGRAYQITAKPRTDDSLVQFVDTIR